VKLPVYINYHLAFGQNDAADSSKYRFWYEAEQLKSIAGEIRSIRHDFGESNPTVLIASCTIRYVAPTCRESHDWLNRSSTN